MQNKQPGFTLIEIMITIAIIGIIASIALPAYLNHTKRAAFAEVIIATVPFKSAFELAAHSGDITSLADADHGINGIPAAAGVSGVITSITVTNGVITVLSTVTGANGIALNYTLTPDGIDAPVRWTVGGSCLAAEIC